ncbi:glycosyltransferase [Spirosoma validum]|uniref:Glycosyltransferase n=1 Tax=Spirosoma validum TaxID=2771355 RepID=A0A927AZN1_9BACT|nr:glycosyltransferase [Spirosoma validum]MBD2752592.1 glycosyltransferase [Spirosoma validum]
MLPRQHNFIALNKTFLSSNIPTVLNPFTASQTDTTTLRFRFMIISSCPEDWGGSEELWGTSAQALARTGHRVFVFKTKVNPEHPRIIDLRQAGCIVTDLYHLSPLPDGWSTETDWTLQTLDHNLRAIQPHLTIVAQGSNFDGMPYADLCRRSNYPYVLIAQKAVDDLYPMDADRSRFQQAYQTAKCAFFVSRHNLELTRLQLALPLPNGKVIVNPVNVPYDPPGDNPFPNTTGVLRLACIARLFVLEKGQDLLLQVLAKAKWRSRELCVTFFGEGPNRIALEEMAGFLGITDRVHFAGHVSDPAAIWQTHHALILPSRSEGLPLALVEAMLCGRPAIAARAGGIDEVLVDNVTGFLAVSPSDMALDEALERAWNRRNEWPALGAEASRYIRTIIPPNATQQFIRQVLDVVHQLHPPVESSAPSNQPLISIIIPTYNRGHLIERAIRSVRAQTYTNWQLIVVDDGSTDDTRQQLASATDIEYHYQDNQGQGSARNAGLRHSRGEYIASLDSDDEWYPNFLSESVAMLQKHELDFVFSNYTNSLGNDACIYFLLQPNGRQRYCTQPDENWWLLTPAQARHLMIESCPAISSSMVMRRSTMPPAWNETMIIADDWCLLLDMVVNRPCRVAFTLTQNWYKHIHDSNIYDQRDAGQVAQELGFHDETLLLKRFQHLLSPAERGIFRKRIGFHHLKYASISRRQGASFSHVMKHLVIGLSLSPAPMSRRILRKIVYRLRPFLKKQLAN